MSIQSVPTHVVLIATDFLLCFTLSSQVNDNDDDDDDDNVKASQINKITTAQHNTAVYNNIRDSSLTFALVSSQDKDLACRMLLLLPIGFSTDTLLLAAPSNPGTERLPDPEAVG